MFDRNKGKTNLNMLYGQAEFEKRVSSSDKDIGYFDFRVFYGSKKEYVPLPFFQHI